MNNIINLKNTIQINAKVTGKQENKFDNQSTLAGRKIKTIIPRVGTTGLKTSNSIDICENLENVYLVLVNSKNVKIHEALPLYMLDPTKNGNSGIVMLDTNEIDWTKSLLYFADATQATANKDKEIPLLVVYE